MKSYYTDGQTNGRESSCHHKASQNTGVSIDTMLIYTYGKYFFQFYLQPTAIYNLSAGLKYTVLKESRAPFRFACVVHLFALSRGYSCTQIPFLIKINM